MKTFTNIGSIQKIEIALAQFVHVSKPDKKNQVTVTNSDAWTEMNFAHLSASFEEPEKQVDQGLVYEPKLIWLMSKNSPDNHVEAYRFSGKKVVIRFTDANGQTYLLGDQDKPVRIMVSRMIPADPGGFNGYKLIAKTQNPRPVPFVA